MDKKCSFIVNYMGLLAKGLVRAGQLHCTMLVWV